MASDGEHQLRQRAGELLSRGDVALVVGYGPAFGGDDVRPVFARDASDADRLVWNDRCRHNLATYLVREPCLEVMSEGGRVGIVAKGCDVRAIVALLQEEQIKRQQVHILGMVCGGMPDPASGGEPLVKCRACEWQVPGVHDDLIGDPSSVRPVEGDPLEDIKAIESMTESERWRYWTGELTRCIKCYACRQACPLCYCKECITEKSRPQWIDRSSSLRGNIAYHFIRAIHLAGRCISCGECSRACPMDIPVDMLSRFLSRKVEEGFEYRPGIDPEEDPFFVKFSDGDPGDFIR